MKKKFAFVLVLFLAASEFFANEYFFSGGQKIIGDKKFFAEAYFAPNSGNYNGYLNWKMPDLIEYGKRFSGKVTIYSTIVFFQEYKIDMLLVWLWDESRGFTDVMKSAGHDGLEQLYYREFNNVDAALDEYHRHRDMYRDML